MNRVVDMIEIQVAAEAICFSQPLPGLVVVATVEFLIS
jgi:hypothetical protein